MFELFKKKKPTVNDVFGQVKLWNREWTAPSKISIVLWNAAHQLSVSAVDDPEIHGINKLQEDSFARFQENLAENQNRIEEILSEYFRTADPDILISKFTPYELLINTNGECAVIAENADDEDTHDVLPGLAVVIYPKMAVFTEEAYSEYVFLSGAEEIKNQLYGRD